jgi:hypothetical protein
MVVNEINRTHVLVPTMYFVSSAYIFCWGMRIESSDITVTGPAAAVLNTEAATLQIVH